MAVDPKRLGAGTLGTSTSSLVAAPSAGKKYILKTIRIVNKTATDVTLNAVTIGGIVVIPQQLVKSSQFVCDTDVHVVEAGDAVATSASVAAALDFYVSGVEVS